MKKQSLALMAAVMAISSSPALSASDINIPKPRTVAQRSSAGGRGRPPQRVPTRGKWSLEELRRLNATVRIKNPKQAAQMNEMHDRWFARKFGPSVGGAS